MKTNKAAEILGWTLGTAAYVMLIAFFACGSLGIGGIFPWFECLFASLVVGLIMGLLMEPKQKQTK